LAKASFSRHRAPNTLVRLHDDAVGASADDDADADEDEDDADDDLDAVREWIEDGSFVLHCGNAYYLDAEGEVT
jgi:hypothetical protein